jgi:DNA-binding XRE family transcriptional regulator
MIGGGALALSPSFNHLLAAEGPNGQPHRFVFIRKSNGNRPTLFSLPSFSEAEKKMDQDKLAFEADLDRTYISHLENNKKSPTVDVLTRLAAALGVSASELLARVERTQQTRGKKPRVTKS